MACDNAKRQAIAEGVFNIIRVMRIAGFYFDDLCFVLHLAEFFTISLYPLPCEGFFAQGAA